jgi:hypothetical protein
MWNNKDMKNVCKTQILSLEHTSGVIKSIAVIDIPGVFMQKGSESGMQAVLKEFSYEKEHNFNLLSMSRLLHKQEWKISHVVTCH